MSNQDKQDVEKIREMCRRAVAEPAYFMEEMVGIYVNDYNLSLIHI